MRVLVCGDRNWTNKNLIRNTLTSIPNLEVVIEGGARGADKLARDVAQELEVFILEYPALWGLYGRAAGMIRNKQMLDEGKPDLVISFHNNIQQSKGTKNMISLASAYGVPAKLYTDRGGVELSY